MTNDFLAMWSDIKDRAELQTADGPNTVYEWADARNIDPEHIREFCGESIKLFFEDLLIGAPPDDALACIIIMALQTSWEVAAKRYASGRPE